MYSYLSVVSLHLQVIRSPSTAPQFVFDWLPLCWIALAIMKNLSFVVSVAVFAVVLPVFVVVVVVAKDIQNVNRKIT